MECAKFEELGLLYVAGELTADAAREYEAHLEGCGDCKREVDLYREESASLFTADMLGEEPSAAVDAEILRVCADPRKMRQPAFVPMMFLKKYAPVPIFLMLVMVAIGGYVRYHKMTAEDLRVKYAAPAEDDSAGVEQDIGNVIDYSDVALGDSAEVDADDDSVKQARPMGNRKTGGVVPVSER